MIRQMLFVVLSVVLLSACASATPQLSPLPIESIELQIRESFPPQVAVRFQGQLLNGCYSPGPISQQRTGNQISVTVLQQHSGAEVCTMIAASVDQTIQLEGPFEPGEYVVRVNDVEQRFTI